MRRSYLQPWETPRGLDVITAILNDRSVRPEGQGMATVRWSLQAQIATDRYYAVHLLGELKDPRAVPDLVAQLQDEDVNYKVAWAWERLAEKQRFKAWWKLHDQNPDVRVIAIEALGKLNAKETLPSIRLLLDDNERFHFGERASVSEAALPAITKLEQRPDSLH
jgi:HEAT repeat protein